MSKENYGWIQTYTGRKIWPLDPNPDDIVIEDIAHALSCVNRFTGHLSEPYSVAQHSLQVSFGVPEELALCGLLHDATEAYLSDLASPLKRTEFMKFYREAEENLWKTIATKFDLPQEMPSEVKNADRRALVTEALTLMTLKPDWEWIDKIEPFEGLIYGGPLYWKANKILFINRFKELTERRKKL